MRILIVDDMPEVIEVLQNEAELELRAHVDTASNGLDAFILSQQYKYDAILTDHNMLIMTGSALIVGIRTRENLNRDTPIWMITAYSTHGIEKIPELQGVVFVKKPVDVESLMKEIRERIS